MTEAQATQMLALLTDLKTLLEACLGELKGIQLNGRPM